MVPDVGEAPLPKPQPVQAGQEGGGVRLLTGEVHVRVAHHGGKAVRRAVSGQGGADVAAVVLGADAHGGQGGQTGQNLQKPAEEGRQGPVRQLAGAPQGPRLVQPVRRDAEGVLVQLPPVAPAVVGGLIGGQGGKRLRQRVQQGRVQAAKDGPGDGDVLHRRVGQGAVVVPENGCEHGCPPSIACLCGPLNSPS